MIPAFAGLYVLCAVIGVHAATLTVTTTADAGAGSLRQAITDATTNAAANTVTFNIPTTDPGFDAPQNRFTITLATPLPSIPLAPFSLSNTQTRAVTIKGNGTFPVLTFVNSAVVTLDNLTITNGGGTSGGGIFMGNSSILNLNNSVVTGNSVSVDGGGIYMKDSTTAFISKSTVSGNSAPNGGGGGIYVFASGTLNIDSSTVSGNSSGNGGAFYNATSGTINATSNTLNGNFATNFGGAIYNAATISLTNNTVTSNAALRGGGIYNAFTATLGNNLVALNSATAGSDLFGGSGLGGTAFTGTYNLIGKIDDSAGLASSPNINGTVAQPLDPVVGPLQNNGGPTFTRALLSGSPAIDKGNSATLILDQRNRQRPVDQPFISNTGNGADIGAFEVQLAPLASGVTIGGRVYITSFRCTAGLANATVKLSDLSGVTRTVVTERGGNYQFDDVAPGQIYVLSVNSKTYVFDPRVTSVTDAISDLDFAASAAGRVLKCREN